MSRKQIADVNSGDLQTILRREDLNLSQKIQHNVQQQRATADKMARGVAILRIMEEIYEKVAKLPDTLCTVRLVVDPQNSDLTVYLDEVDAKAVISRRHMDWIKAKDEKRVTDGELPPWLSIAMEVHMFAIEKMVRSHGGRTVAWGQAKKGTRFTYRGPFLPRARLREFIRTACETADLPWDSWKRFWRRNSKKITKDLERYFELDSQEFPRWIW